MNTALGQEKVGVCLGKFASRFAGSSKLAGSQGRYVRSESEEGCRERGAGIWCLREKKSCGVRRVVQKELCETECAESCSPKLLE